VTDIVERIKVEHWTNSVGEDVTSYRVTLVNETGQREVNCYSPLGKDLKEDTPLPEGWEVKTSKAGKPYLAAPRLTSGGSGSPRGPGVPAAWRNTEAGAKYEQERMDRRTALMQAVAADGEWYWNAEKFYEWLRKSVDGGGGQSNSSAPQEAAPPSSAKQEWPDPIDYETSEHRPRRTPNQPPPGWDAQ
jgi:hypothetical protein